MEKMIFEATVPTSELKVEDNGCAIILDPEWKTQNTDDKIFVRIQSWDEDIYDNPLFDDKMSRQEKSKLGHESIHSLAGKKIRVTIEVIEE